MKLTVISDTHGEQENLGTLSGDVLIHCGDMFNMFNEANEDFDRLDDWFGRQDFELIICTGGNHDFELQKRALYTDRPFRNAVFLEGASFEFRDVVFFGAPWVPDLYGQAFFKDDHELADKWADIPENVDVLITHTPPLGVLDVSSSGMVLGCRHLSKAIERTQPKVHCFGHVHASSGTQVDGRTTYINAALVNSRYQISRPPYEIEI